MSAGTTELEHSHVGKAVCVHSHHASRNNKTRYVLRNVKVHHTKKHTSTGNATAAAGRCALIDADGVVTELNDKAFEAAMNAAMGVMGRHRMITTGQAAKLMNCSPRTVARILDSGRLPFTRNGGTGRRMVDVVDIMEYQRRERARMRESLDAMRRASREITMDDDEMAAYVAQFD